MAADLSAIAASFGKAWSEHRQIDFASGLNTAEEAYRIQDLVFAERHPAGRACAWKAGTSGPGIEPTGAPIGRVLASPAAVAHDECHMFGIEGEIAFRLGQDLPARDQAWSEAELSAAIAEVLVTIELCDTRLANWTAASALSRLADFQLNAALVMGTGTMRWQGIDFSAQHAELWTNGLKKVDRTGAHPLGNPLGIMPWAAAHCAQRAGGLKKGDIVTTGSWTGMEFVLPGDRVRVHFPGIGEASLNIG